MNEIERAITIRPPWSWGVLHAGKSPENRSRGAAGWKYRGRLWVHEALTWSPRGAEHPDIIQAWLDEHPEHPYRHIRQVPRGATDWHPGHVIGHVELEDIHIATGCCHPWGEDSYTEDEGHQVVEVAHLVFTDPVVLEVPIPARGHLGLWPIDPAAVAA